MRLRAADAEDERLCKLLRGRLLQGHAATMCVCSSEELHGGVCACALDAPASVASRDPWDLAGAAAELKALADGQAARLSRKSAALRATERDAHDHGWRCIFIKEDATAAAARARGRGTPSGRWRRRGAGELTGAPACVGIACACYDFEPTPGRHDISKEDASSSRWELREYREAARRDEAAVHLLLCCVRRVDDAPATPQPAQSASDEADEALAAVLLGDAEEMSDETQRDAAPSS